MGLPAKPWGYEEVVESLPWDSPDANPLQDIQRFMDHRRDEAVSFRRIFEPSIEKVTRVLEQTGHRIWFTCEVDGVEYRLAARKE